MFVDRSRILIITLFFSVVPCLVGAANWNPLVDTGQKKCYDASGAEIACPAAGQPLHGQDAQYQGRSASYTDNGNGTVTDNNTELVWQKADDGIERNWQDASDYCGQLSLGGHSDWRLPLPIELESIIAYHGSVPAIDTSVFQGKSDYYWASTTVPFNNYKWQADFGSAGSARTGWMAHTGSAYSRCVRGASTSMGPYTDNGDKTVSDEATGLIWQQGTADTNGDGSISSSDMVNWQEALAYCEGLTFAGHSDWRLPNIREMFSLGDRSTYRPAVNPVFQTVIDGYYWSSTSAENAYYAKTYDSNGGSSGLWVGKSEDRYVRCARGGLKPQANIVPILSSLLLTKHLTASSELNEDVIAIGDGNVADILSTTINSTDETELQLFGDLADSAENGSILYVLPGSDNRFPFGIAGRIVSSNNNTDGTKNVVLEEVTYADVVKEASVKLDDIVLDASNFVGVIAPAAVEAASPVPMLAESSLESGGKVYSFRDGAIVVRQARDNEGEMYFRAEESAIDAGTVSLNMKVELSKMGVDVSNLTSVDGSLAFIISGSLDHIKVTNNYDFSFIPPALEANLHLESDINFDVKLKANGAATFGYFSSAWEDVEKSMFDKFGISAQLTGLSKKDQIGKYPLAGLVFSLPCPPNKPCIVTPGDTRTPLAAAYHGGLIVWIYLNIKGGFSGDLDVTFAKLYPARLSLGIKKTLGGDFQRIQFLKRISSSGRLLEAPKFKGSVDFQVQAGITTELDFIAGGVRIINGGLDTLVNLRMGMTGEASYGTDSLDSEWSWETNACFTTNIGAGAIGRLSANFGIQVDSVWKNFSGGFEYSGQ
jgi:hypothetical protein